MPTLTKKNGAYTISAKKGGLTFSANVSKVRTMLTLSTMFDNLTADIVELADIAETAKKGDKANAQAHAEYLGWPLNHALAAAKWVAKLELDYHADAALKSGLDVYKF